MAVSFKPWHVAGHTECTDIEYQREKAASDLQRVQIIKEQVDMGWGLLHSYPQVDRRHDWSNPGPFSWELLHNPASSLFKLLALEKTLRMVFIKLFVSRLAKKMTRPNQAGHFYAEEVAALSALNCHTGFEAGLACILNWVWMGGSIPHMGTLVPMHGSGQLKLDCVKIEEGCVH